VEKHKKGVEGRHGNEIFSLQLLVHFTNSRVLPLLGLNSRQGSVVNTSPHGCCDKESSHRVSRDPMSVQNRQAQKPTLSADHLVL